MSFEVRIKSLTLKARVELQQRTAIACRARANNARLNHQDEVAAVYDRSAEFAEMRAAALFSELLELA
jgi:hypothetical protein